MAREKKFHPETPLGRWREKMNLGQEPAADIFGISQSHFCNLEQGRFEPVGPLKKLIDHILADPSKPESANAL